MSGRCRRVTPADFVPRGQGWTGAHAMTGTNTKLTAAVETYFADLGRVARVGQSDWGAIKLRAPRQSVERRRRDAQAEGVLRRRAC